MKFLSFKAIFVLFCAIGALNAFYVIRAQDDIDCEECCKNNFADPECCRKCSNCPLSEGQIRCHNYPAD